MEMQRLFFVAPDGGVWRVYEQGDDSSTARAFPSKDSAIEAGKKLAQGFGPSLLKVLTTTGGIELEQPFEKDPLVEQLEKSGF